MTAPCARLTDYLRQSGAGSVPMTFVELESVRGKPLPASARKYAAWWSNTQPHARCWITAGYRVAHVRLTDECWLALSSVIHDGARRAFSLRWTA